MNDEICPAGTQKQADKYWEAQWFIGELHQ